MTTILRAARYAAYGFTTGALLTLTAGLGYALTDWNRAAKKARRTAHAYGRPTR